MKTPKIIVVLLILLTVSAYATHGPVKGYTADNCTGVYREFDSYTDLVLAHDEEDKNNDNKVWTCGSYEFDNDPEEECHEFEDIPTIKVVGTPLPDWDSDVESGDPGSASVFDGQVDWGDDNPGKNFDQEDVDEIKDCLLDAAASNESIANWIGDRTEATWLDETNENWESTDDDSWRYDKYGEATYSGNTANFTTTVKMHGINMGNSALTIPIPYRHMLIYWHLHEYVHVLQAEQERNDGDERFSPSLTDSYEVFLRELEAIETVDEWWRALFGDDFDPPFTMPPELVSYDEDKERWAELQQKNLNGTISEDEKKELVDLTNYFIELHQTVPKAEPVENYQKKKLKHCA